MGVSRIPEVTNTEPQKMNAPARSHNKLRKVISIVSVGLIVFGLLCVKRAYRSDRVESNVLSVRAGDCPLDSFSVKEMKFQSTVIPDDAMMTREDICSFVRQVALESDEMAVVAAKNLCGEFAREIKEWGNGDLNTGLEYFDSDMRPQMASDDAAKKRQLLSTCAEFDQEKYAVPIPGMRVEIYSVGTATHDAVRCKAFLVAHYLNDDNFLTELEVSSGCPYRIAKLTSADAVRGVPTNQGSPVLGGELIRARYGYTGALPLTNTRNGIPYAFAYTAFPSGRERVP